jgi:hypothetical protein
VTRLPDPTRPRSVVLWGVVCGLVAGLAAAAYFRLAGEPAIDEAIAIEEAMAASPADEAPEGDDEGVEVSRSTQRGAGLFGAFAAFGAAYGLLLAAAAFSLRGDWLDPFRRVVVAGTILAGAITGATWLKYPPNPPGVGNPSTAGERQSLYYLLIVLVALALAGAAHLSGRLRRAGWADAHRITTVAAAVAVVVGAVLAVMPPADVTIPAEVGASLVWRFRIASLGGNLLLWGLLSLGFGALCAEAQRRRTGGQNSMPFRAEIPLS